MIIQGSRRLSAHPSLSLQQPHRIHETFFTKQLHAAGGGGNRLMQAFQIVHWELKKHDKTLQLGPFPQGMYRYRGW